MLNNLLSKTDNRRFKLINFLARKTEPIFISELAKEIGVSSRVIKDDLAFFRKEYDDFTLHSSQSGIELTFKKNKGLKTISKIILAQSIPYQLLETIFLDETLSATEVADKLFISISTFYRVVNEINDALDPHELYIETNPCQIVGNEYNIRYFAYQYFFERYSRTQWPFKYFDENIIDDFLKLFIQFTNNPNSYASLTTLKIIFTINLIRYKNNHYVQTDQILESYQNIYSDFNDYNYLFKKFEENTEVQINDDFIKQIFYAYLDDHFILTYDIFKKKAQTNKTYAEELVFLNAFFDDLCETHQLDLSNKGHVLATLHDSAYLEYFEPRSGYILYNQHKYFAKAIEEEFPMFYKDLYDGVSEYRKIIGALDTEKGKYFLIYTIFVHWRYLIPNLQKRYNKIKTLIVSEHHIYHAYMLEDFLKHEYPTQVETHVFSEIYIDEKVLEESTYELIVTNTPFSELKTKELVYIQNVPTYKDLTKIQTAINKIIVKRKQNRENE